MSRSRTSRRSISFAVTPWHGVCFALAVPIVFFFEQYIFEGFTALSLLPMWIFGTGLDAAGRSFQSLAPGSSSGTESIGTAIIAIPLLLLMLVVWIVVGLIALAIFVPLGIVCFSTWSLFSWLASNPGLPRHLLSLIFVWYVGLFLYGVAFPLLWKALEPWLAHTLAELTYQRARARIFGDRPRYRQPLYLLVGSLALFIAVADVGTAAGLVAGRAADSAWKQEVTARFFPRPPEWPKTITVPAHRSVPTGVQVGGSETAVAFHSAEEVQVSVTDTGNRWGIHGQNSDEQTAWITFPGSGELYLHGGATAATVTIYKQQ